MRYLAVVPWVVVEVGILSAGSTWAQESGNVEAGSAPASPAGFELPTLGSLPRLPGLHSVHQFSSHNKQGLNGDAKWRLYDDEHGDAVIFDVEGPGCVRSIWSTAIHEDAVLKFTFDGEKAPRLEIPMLEFFQGNHPLFPAPLNSYEKRGRWGEKPYAGNSFVPIPFARGLKIAVSGPLNFYHILFQRYPHGTEVTTFTGMEDRSYLLDAFLSPDHAAGAPALMETRTSTAETIDPGGTLTLLDLKQRGCIRRLTLEGEASDSFLREAMITTQWDGHSRCDVNAPIGYFFGSAVHAAEVRSLPVRVERVKEHRVRLTFRFPMPFWRSAVIRLVNRAARALGPVSAEFQIDSEVPPEASAGYLTTSFRRGVTPYGRDWLFFERPGTGWFLGVVQSMQGEHYCEGDEHFYLDGAISPQIHGTGSEDYFLGCFWPNRPFSSPFANCVGDIQEEGGGTFEGAYTVPSCYSRFHLDAPIPFFSRIDAKIQHGGLNTIASNYGSLAFAYLRARPSLALSDFLDVGSPTSEAAHGYRATSSELYGPITASPEGDDLDVAIVDTGRTHSGGAITFTVAVDPRNRGVRLRRRLDQGSPRQTAAVFIDGAHVGSWYHPDHNEHLRWFDSDFDIHPRFTVGKDKLRVRLEVRTGDGRGFYTDFRYEVFSHLP